MRDRASARPRRRAPPAARGPAAARPARARNPQARVARGRHARVLRLRRWRTAARVSVVEVSPSTVIAVEDLSAARRQQRLQRRRRDLRVGEDEAQHRRHVGRDHAGALGDAGDRDRARRRSWPCASAPFGKVSVVMIARAASCPSRRRQRCVQAGQRRRSASPSAAARRSRRSRRGTPRSACSRPASPPRPPSPPRPRARRVPVKTLALPALTTSARALPRLSALAAPVDRRAGAVCDFVNTPATVVPGGKLRHHHVLARPCSGSRCGRRRGARREFPADRGTCQEQAGSGRAWGICRAVLRGFRGCVLRGLDPRIHREPRDGPADQVRGDDINN